jgi:hypothetical protein
MTVLRKKLMEKRKARKGNKSSKGASIKRRLSAIETKIRKGSETMLLASKSDLADLSETLADWREQRDTLKSQLAEIDGSDETKVSVDDAIAELRNLRKAMDGASKPKLREILQRIFSHVEIFWEPRHSGGGEHYQMFKVARGLAVFRDGIHAKPIEFGRPELDNLDPIERTAIAVWEAFDGTNPVTAKDVAHQMGRENTGTTHRDLPIAEEHGLLGSCEIDISVGKRTTKAYFPTKHSLFTRYHNRKVV